MEKKCVYEYMSKTIKTKTKTATFGQYADANEKGRSKKKDEKKLFRLCLLFMMKNEKENNKQE